MAFMDKVERGGLRSASESEYPLSGPFWFNPVGSHSNMTDFPVSPATAMRISAVFACVSLIAETIASLPCILYRRLPNGGKERATDHWLYPILARSPNRWQTRFEFFELLVRHLLLRGNAYAQKSPATGELLPIHPDRVTIERLPNGRFRYKVKGGADVEDDTLLQDQVLHFRDAGEDGIAGVARSVLAREAIAIAGAGEAFSARWLRNDGSGRVVLEHPQRLEEKVRTDIHAEYQKKKAGWANNGSLLLAEGGAKFSILPSLAQSGFLIDPRRFQLADIARFYRVPLFMLQETEKSTSWGTGIEQMKQGFVDFTARPWGTRIEQVLMRDLLGDDEQDDLLVAFMYEELLRGDTLSVVTSLGTMIDKGMANPNEARAKLNMNPREDPGGEKYQETPIGGAPNRAPAAAQPQQDEEAVATFSDRPMLADAATRIAAAEVREVEKRATKAAADESKFSAWVRGFYAEHGAYALKVLAPLASEYGLAAPAAADAAARIERTGVAAVAEGVPSGWAARRREEVAQIIDETFRAAAALRRAA
jgi:HK97 family phage portal protein